MVALFYMVWEPTDSSSDSTISERHGLQYIDALVNVELALAESQTMIMTGQSSSGARLGVALDEAGELDERYGDELRTHERWDALRGQIEALSDWNEDPVAAYTASEEAADLLLALVEKVRVSSGLIRDPEADIYYLQDAAGQESPEAIVASSRLVGLALLVVTGIDFDQDEIRAELMSAKSLLSSNVDDLADDLRQTVDATDNETLSGNLLAPLDSFRQAVESLIPAATATNGNDLDIDAGEVSRSWEEARTAMESLSSVMLAEAQELLEERSDSLARKKVVSVGILAFGVLVIVTPPAVATRRELRSEAARPGPTTQPDNAVELADWELTGVAQ